MSLLQAPNVRKRAEQAGEAFIEMLNPWSTRLVLPALYSGFEGRRNWQVGFSLTGVSILSHTCARSSGARAACVPIIAGAYFRTRGARPHFGQYSLSPETCIFWPVSVFGRFGCLFYVPDIYAGWVY